MKNKVVSRAQAAALIRDGDTVAFSGFVGTGTPEALIVGLEERFQATRPPRDLTFVFAPAPGKGKDLGLNRLPGERLVARAIGGQWWLVPRVGRVAMT